MQGEGNDRCWYYGKELCSTVQWVHIVPKRVNSMGKYVGYVILVLVVLFAVEFFGIIDIPYFDIPNYFSDKEDMIDKTENVMKQLN